VRRPAKPVSLPRFIDGIAATYGTEFVPSTCARFAPGTVFAYMPGALDRSVDRINDGLQKCIFNYGHDGKRLARGGHGFRFRKRDGYLGVRIFDRVAIAVAEATGREALSLGVEVIETLRTKRTTDGRRKVWILRAKIYELSLVKAGAVEGAVLLV
jgi:hypothetical protein